MISKNRYFDSVGCWDFCVWYCILYWYIINKKPRKEIITIFRRMLQPQRRENRHSFKNPLPENAGPLRRKAAKRLLQALASPRVHVSPSRRQPSLANIFSRVALVGALPRSASSWCKVVIKLCHPHAPSSHRAPWWSVGHNYFSGNSVAIQWQIITMQRLISGYSGDFRTHDQPYRI